MMQAVAYLRVSTEGQVEAWGLDAQRYAVEVYAAAQSIEIVAVVVDKAISGRSACRRSARASRCHLDAQGAGR